jgi:hypothetical protein
MREISASEVEQVSGGVYVGPGGAAAIWLLAKLGGIV